MRRRLRQEYAGALTAYIANAGEPALKGAYELGREMLSKGLGVLDHIALYNEAMAAIVADKLAPEVREDLGRGGAFLAESLSAFEMSLRGYRETNSRLAALQASLEQKIEERTRELVRANKVKDDFIAMVSHELRTPLTSINAVVALLDGGALGTLSSAMSRTIQLARRNCERLIRIVEDLLDQTKIAHGAFDLRLQTADLESILLQVVESRRINPATPSISFTIADQAKGVRVAADPPRLQQVLDNLLNNAVKFSDANSPIEVAVERHDEHVRVAVIDHGIGIAPDYCNEVFKPFTQADSSSTRAAGGVGLGLSIARAIVQAHRGTMEFSSIEGSGSMFYFDLPISAAS